MNRATFDEINYIINHQNGGTTMKGIAWIGKDVHQETITVSVYVGEEQEPRIEKTIKNEKRAVGKFYKRLDRE